jgi:hypothetical protein
MKTIKKDEIFRSLSNFLNAKGVELKDGVYAQSINRACGLLTDAINGTQKTVKRAKVEVDKKLGELRQTVHAATAPQPPPVTPKAEKARAGGAKKTTARTKPKSSTAPQKSSRRK